jgi:hypothetical protein
MGRKRLSDATTGKDMARRCYDATLFFLLQSLPLSPVVRTCVSEQLASRWVPVSNSSAAASAATDPAPSTNAYSYAVTTAASAAAEIDTAGLQGNKTANRNNGGARMKSAARSPGLGFRKSGTKQGSEGLSVDAGFYFEGVRRNPEDADLAGPGHGCLVAKDFSP